MESFHALVVLNLLPGIGPIRIRALEEEFGSLSTVFTRSRGELARVPGIGDKLAQQIVDWQQFCDLKSELSACSDAGVKIITFQDPDYPPLLKELRDAPVILYVIGDSACLREAEKTVAVVGTRHPSRYGEQMSRKLCAEAVAGGWTVVSGLAQGIDTCAHKATLDEGGKTIAVLGGGVGRIFPFENVALARRIADSGGAVISEFPLLAAPAKHTFPMRNRIVAGMTRATLCVEAGTGSGSLITCNLALEQGRSVLAVPGQVTSPQSRGCHSLLRDGARLCENFDDVIDELSFLPGIKRVKNAVAAPSAKTSAQALRQPELFPVVQLSPLELKILDTLSRGDATADTLQDETGETPGKLFAALLEMELRGQVKPLPGRRFTACV